MDGIPADYSTLTTHQQVDEGNLTSCEAPKGK